MRWLIGWLAAAVMLFGADAGTIIKKVEENFRGKDVYMKMKMVISSERGERTVEIESWSVGKKKSFMKILYPPRDEGITFLKLENQLWQYVPKIERIVKIPPSMMLQSWMGSDFTNDDMVKESSISDDYDAKVVKTEGNRTTIALTPKPDAAVVWGKILTEIDTQTYTQVHDVYYDDFGAAVREMFYSDVKTFNGHHVPTVMQVKPLEKGKEKNKTMVLLSDVVYDKGISDSYFTKQALKRYSQ